MTLTIVKVEDALWFAEIHDVFVEVCPASDSDLWEAAAIDWGHLVIAKAPKERIETTLAGIPRPVLWNLLGCWWHSTHPRPRKHQRPGPPSPR